MKTFSQFIQESQKVLEIIDRKYSRRYPGVNIDASYDKASNRIRVNQLFVPPDQRGKGIGTRIMKGLGKYADKNNIQMTLKQDPDKGREKDLDNFYNKHGFIPNRGDSTTKDTHIRNPR